jgi:hypothetical protein
METKKHLFETLWRQFLTEDVDSSTMSTFAELEAVMNEPGQRIAYGTPELVNKLRSFKQFIRINHIDAMYVNNPKIWTAEKLLSTVKINNQPLGLTVKPKTPIKIVFEKQYRTGSPAVFTAFIAYS